jgi:hypothetical protein
VFPEDGGSEEEVVVVVVLLGESVILPLVPTNVGEYVRSVPVPRKVGGYDTWTGCAVGTDTLEEDGFDPASAAATIDSLVGLRKKLNETAKAHAASKPKMIRTQHFTFPRRLLSCRSSSSSSSSSSS